MLFGGLMQDSKNCIFDSWVMLFNKKTFGRRRDWPESKGYNIVFYLWIVFKISGRIEEITSVRSA